MSAEERKQELALYRIKQAYESLDEAKFLMKGGKSVRSVINRLYYSMFYAILGLLVFEEYSSSKHSGVLSYFNRHFVKGKIFSEDYGRAVNRTFEMRNRGDYREFVELSVEETAALLNTAERFINEVERHLISERFK